jgi:hypothetical protein
MKIAAICILLYMAYLIVAGIVHLFKGELARGTLDLATAVGIVSVAAFLHRVGVPNPF